MFERYYFEGSEDKPKVDFNPQKNIFEITGNSFPEESSKFFIPLIQWLEDYSSNPNEQTHLIFRLDYFNSLSGKFIYEILYTLQKVLQTGKKINISWYYNADDTFIEEKGEEFKSAIEIPFELVQIQ